jgi:hypothetical protein
LEAEDGVLPLVTMPDEVDVCGESGVLDFREMQVVKALVLVGEQLVQVNLDNSREVEHGFGGFPREKITAASST